VWNNQSFETDVKRRRNVVEFELSVSLQRLILSPSCLRLLHQADGATENARPDIARLDNVRPCSKGGHRETCFNARVSAQ